MSYHRFLESLRVAAALLGIGCLAALLAVLLYGARAARQATLTEQQASRTLIVLGGASTNLQKTLAIEQKAAADQAAAFQHTLELTNARLADVGTTIGKLNKTIDSVNATADSLNAAVKDQNEGLGRVEGAASGAIGQLMADEEALRPTIVSAGIVTTQLAELAGNPEIPQTIHNMNMTSAHLASTSAHADQMTADLAAWIHRWTAPVHGIYNHLKSFISTWGPTAANVAVRK